ncbi:DUF7437 domain-containing protein [Halonotius sp. GCM10025705]|uniref:DUF7437 domain-containing protein n=1 Tax=Halonotius sp. GCM10025705 TaxID=3252678 RepID=UPI003619809B
MVAGSDTGHDLLADIEFVHEDDGRVTARHVEAGVASFGDTESEALRQLADALVSHFGDGEEISDPQAYLADRGIDVEIDDQRPAEYDTKTIPRTSSTDDDSQTITSALIAAVARGETDEDIDVFIDRHGLDGLAAAVEYAADYVEGTVNHRITARELDLSPLEAEIILQALEPVVTEYRIT